MTSDEIESFIDARHGGLSSDEIALLMDADKNPQIDHFNQPSGNLRIHYGIP